MPLKGVKIIDSPKRITFFDRMPFRFKEVIKDEETVYPVQVFKDFVKYLNSKYHSGVYGDCFVREGNNKSRIELVFYVPGNIKKEEVIKDVKEFESKYNGLTIDIKMNRSTQEQYNTLGAKFSDLVSFHKKDKRENPDKTSKLEKCIAEFTKLYNREPDLESQEDQKKIENLSTWLSLNWVEGGLDIAKKLFKLNWGTEPNLDSEEDRDELILLYNMNQEGYQSHYTVDAVMHFNTPIFSPKTADRQQIDLFDYYVHDSKCLKDSTSKTYKFDFSLDAWIQGIEIEADSLEEAEEKFNNMSIEDLLENGYVKDYEKKNIDVEIEEDFDDLDDEDFEIPEDYDSPFEDSKKSLTEDSKHDSNEEIAEAFAKRYKK